MRFLQPLSDWTTVLERLRTKYVEHQTVSWNEATPGTRVLDHYHMIVRLYYAIYTHMLTQHNQEIGR